MPETLLLEDGPDGERLLRGIRYRWNTGETQVMWWDDAPCDPDLLDEEPVLAGAWQSG